MASNIFECFLLQDAKKSSVREEGGEKGSKTWYERIREENLKANAAFLASLNMKEVNSVR